MTPAPHRAAAAAAALRGGCSHARPRLRGASLCLVLALAGAILAASGCHEPPLYTTRAARVLRSASVNEDTIDRLSRRRPLEPEEVELLATFEEVPVLHLLGINESTSEDVLRRLAAHADPEVRAGVAANPAAPPELLDSLRGQELRILKEALASNRGYAPAKLRTLFEANTTAWTAFAANPALPADLKMRIATEGDSRARYWLALNPELPAEVLEVLRRDELGSVRDNVARRAAWGWDED